MEEADNMVNKKRYDTALRSLPGMTFRVDIADPKERVRAYLDSFGDERIDVSCSFLQGHEPSLCPFQ